MLQKLLIVGLAVTFAAGVEKEGDDPLDWLRNSIPGEPGVDYPIFSAVEQTQFECGDDKVFGGYYADPEMGCQAYHVCLLDPLSGSMYPTSFLCPNGTLFQQQIFNCDWWYNVDCATSESYYSLAEGAFGSDGGNGDGGDNGQCPAANPLSDAECAGAVSNCWSPGQSDTDCPNFGLCCFDGCADTCVDGPATQQDTRPQAQQPEYQPEPPPPPPQVTPRPTPAPTRPPAPVQTTGYNYPVPENPLPIRPTEPPALYGAPPPGGRSGRNGRRRGRNGGRRGRRGRRLRRRRKVARKTSEAVAAEYQQSIEEREEPFVLYL